MEPDITGCSDLRRPSVSRLHGSYPPVGCRIREGMHCFLLALLTFPLAFAGSDDWPGWRGPSANGVSTLKNLPTEWSAEKNVAWRADLAGKGHSSPSIWGNRIFLTTDIAGDPIPGKVIPKHLMRGGTRFRNPDSCCAGRKPALKVLCIGASTGKQSWEPTAFDGEVYDEVHRTADYATTTDATD